MASTTHEMPPHPTTTSTDWHALAQQVLSGSPLNQQQAMQILTCPDDELLDLMSATFRIRKQYFGKTVQLYFLMNAKSGLCPEDCSYCSQSKDSTAEIPKYNILSRDKLLDGARIAAERNAKTYCIVISARAPSERELAAVETIVPHIKEQYDLKICACLGLLSDDQAQRLCDAGVDRVNHNLNTSESNYKNICTTHSYQDRIDTLHAVRRAGMEICSGGIIGMGEKDQDVIDMAFALRDLEADSIPLNFLNAIEGTQLENINTLTPQY